MGRHFPVREKSGNFSQNPGKIRKKLYWKIEKKYCKSQENLSASNGETLQIWYHTLNKKRTLKNTGKLPKLLEKSGKFVSLKKVGTMLKYTYTVVIFITPIKFYHFRFIIELCEPVQVRNLEIVNLELFSSLPESFVAHISDRFVLFFYCTHILKLHYYVAYFFFKLLHNVLFPLWPLPIFQLRNMS